MSQAFGAHDMPQRSRSMVILCLLTFWVPFICPLGSKWVPCFELRVKCSGDKSVSLYLAIPWFGLVPH